MHELWLPGGVRTEIRLTGADTGDAFCLLVDEAPPGWALPAHRHAHESETIHVLSGTMWLVLEGDDDRVEIPAGSTVHIPAGMLHEGGTAGDEPVERLVVFAPAGIETFFAAIGREHEDDPPVALDELLRQAAAFGWRFAD